MVKILFWSITQESCGLLKFIAICEFCGNLLKDTCIISKEKVLIMLRWCTKHANFLLGI